MLCCPGLFSAQRNCKYLRQAVGFLQQSRLIKLTSELGSRSSNMRGCCLCVDVCVCLCVLLWGNLHANADCLLIQIYFVRHKSSVSLPKLMFSLSVHPWICNNNLELTGHPGPGSESHVDACCPPWAIFKRPASQIQMRRMVGMYQTSHLIWHLPQNELWCWGKTAKSWAKSSRACCNMAASKLHPLFVVSIWSYHS